MKNQRTKVFQLRLTSDELLNLKEKAVPYQSVSNYIRKAVEEFTHVDVKQQIEMMQDLCAFYRKFQNELSWAGSNLNQSVRRVNELAVAGLLSPGYVNEVLLPSIQDVQNILITEPRKMNSSVPSMKPPHAPLTMWSTISSMPYSNPAAAVSAIWRFMPWLSMR